MKRSHLAGLMVFGLLAARCGGDDSSADGSSASTGGSAGSAGSSNASGGSSGTSDGSGGGAGGPATGAVECPDDIANLARAVAEAICQKRAQCCDNDLDECIDEVRTAFETGYPNLSQAESDGSAALDCDAFDACAEAVAATSCDDWPFQASVGIPADELECYDFLTPLLQDSDECRFSYECASGYCSVAEGETSGACYDYAAENEACGEDGEPDQVCDSQSMFCNQAGLCQRRLGLGAACTENNECQSLTCDMDGSETCIVPGQAQCEYTIATAPANCSVVAPGAGDPPGAHVLWSLLGLWALRRRRWPTKRQGTPPGQRRSCHRLKFG